ncbi:MAG TPA: D-glycero-beta-D-manno-heptose-7-phosphate kinase [Kiritimatiellia bacterium]|nr:D-glycero-beta-D-manno-heptose-7-phosphate kinase [Kiritimatiellia bacterium]HMO98096.1 D-glycero-beta-D-manno-heptose-7-phosphate kinase [Kiritimatiellia bacterium]
MTLHRSRAAALLGQFPSRRILVIGDLMLDRYIMGSVNRISPEAPVPVVHVHTEKAVPGGASNVALNIRSLAGQAGVAGVIGCDDNGRELASLLAARGVDTAAMVNDPSIPTTVKTRVIAERQQVVRIDWEEAFHYADATLAEFERRLVAEIERADGVILEDYGKGVIVQDVVDTALRAAKARGVPVGLDPKDNHVLNVSGITLATPNRKEAFSAAGVTETRPSAHPLEDAALRHVGQVLLEKWNPELLMITLGAQGMLLLEQGREPVHVPTRAREVFDVSGAGDTVIATCVLARAAGASFLEAAEIANYAAGVVVAKIGTATCTPDELLSWMPEEV